MPAAINASVQRRGISGGNRGTSQDIYMRGKLLEHVVTLAAVVILKKVF